MASVLKQARALPLDLEDLDFTDERVSQKFYRLFKAAEERAVVLYRKAYPLMRSFKHWRWSRCEQLSQLASGSIEHQATEIPY